jgi:hypothetical protein
MRMHKFKTAVSALTIGFLLVMSIDYMAFAATGKSMILGKANSANKVTKLTRTTSGPAMEFKVKNGVGAPIKVNSKGRIGKLNADLVDGKHAADLGVRTLAYEANVNVTGVTGFNITLPNVPAGNYLATMDGWIYGPSGGWLYCRLDGIGGSSRLDQVVAGVGTYYSFAGAADINVASTGNLDVICYSNLSGNWTDYNNFHVSLTRIDRLTSTLIAPRPITKSGPGAAR